MTHRAQTALPAFVSKAVLFYSLFYLLRRRCVTSQYAKCLHTGSIVELLTVITSIAGQWHNH
jgi:hypothetical protein